MIASSKAARIFLAAIVALGAVSCSRAKLLSPLRVAIAPYQDLAMLVNAQPLGLTQQYGVDLELVSMAWEDILPAVASSGPTVDVGFGSLVEFLTKYHTLNRDAADPVVFVEPLYVYKGGGFVATDPNVPVIDKAALRVPESVRAFLALRLGAQKQSLYEMMLFTLAGRSGLPPSSLRITDISMNDGLLALQSGSLDATSAGLTQLTEIRKRGGRLVLSMEDTGFADIVGFIAKRSVVEARKQQIVDLIEMWLSSVDYVLSDIDRNSVHSLHYLRSHAATQYSLDEYRAALSQEFLPRSMDELQSGVLASGAPYDFQRIGKDIVSYLLATGVVREAPPLPEPIVVRAPER